MLRAMSGESQAKVDPRLLGIDVLGARGISGTPRHPATEAEVPDCVFIFSKALHPFFLLLSQGQRSHL